MQKTPEPQHAPFDRLRHGTEGLPTCRHCGHRFRPWILSNMCRGTDARSLDGKKTLFLPGATRLGEESPPPASPPDPPQAEITSATEAVTETGPQAEVQQLPAAAISPQASPLKDWPVVHQILQAGAWTERSDVQQYLHHHCPLCV